MPVPPDRRAQLLGWTRVPWRPRLCEALTFLGGRLGVPGGVRTAALYQACKTIPPDRLKISSSFPFRVKTSTRTPAITIRILKILSNSMTSVKNKGKKEEIKSIDDLIVCLEKLRRINKIIRFIKKWSDQIKNEYIKPSTKHEKLKWKLHKNS